MRIVFFALLLLFLSLAIWYVASVQNWSMKVEPVDVKPLQNRVQENTQTWEKWCKENPSQCKG